MSRSASAPKPPLTTSPPFSPNPVGPGEPHPVYAPLLDTVSIPPAGGFAVTPNGVILHATRSGGGNDTLQEFRSTLNYVRSGADGLGWNATIGDDMISIHLPANKWAWNARAASSKYLAVEFAQAVEARGISDGQVRAFAWWWRNHARAQWPGLPLTLKTHAEVEHSGETGAHDGKSDAFSYGSPKADELRERIIAEIQEQGG